MMQGENDLDEPGHPRGAFGVSNVRLDRPDPALRGPGPAVGQHRPEGAEFDGVSGARSGTVRLDVLRLTRGHTGIRVGPP